MHFSLTNNTLKITVSELGAELQSLSATHSDEEFLWQGDKSIWSGRAPVLFPVVGALKDSQMSVAGKIYSLPRHGFARRSTFKCINKERDQVQFQLKSNADTLTVFPWQFTLEISYKLMDNRLLISYSVHHASTDTDDKMLFAIGSHPAFRLPLAELTIDQFSIRFSKAETLQKFPLSADGLLANKGVDYPLTENKITLQDTTFNDDALVFKNIESESISLWQREIERVRVNTGGAPHLGLWAKPGAPYVCIEPWHGYSDPEDASGYFKDKPALISLESGAEWRTDWSIELPSI